MSFNQISNINLFSKDSKKLINFYRDILGIPAMEGQDENADWYGFKTEGVELAIEPEFNKAEIEAELNIKRNDTLLIQFKASSLDELVKMSEDIEAKGITLLSKAVKRSYGYCTNFFDPEGNFLEIYFPGK